MSYYRIYLITFGACEKKNSSFFLSNDDLIRIDSGIFYNIHSNLNLI